MVWNLYLLIAYQNFKCPRFHFCFLSTMNSKNCFLLLFFNPKIGAGTFHPFQYFPWTICRPNYKKLRSWFANYFPMDFILFIDKIMPLMIKTLTSYLPFHSLYKNHDTPAITDQTLLIPSNEKIQFFAAENMSANFEHS